jgi:hypothetical protein
VRDLFSPSGGKRRFPKSALCGFHLFPKSVLALLVTLPAGAATPAISWGGQYISRADEPFEGDIASNRGSSDKYGDPDGPFTIVGGTIVGRAYSADTPFSPPTDYSGTSGTFFGASSVTRSGTSSNDGFSELGIIDQGPNDSIHWHVDTGGDDHTFHLLVYWDKADFLGPLSTTPNLDLSQGAFTIGTSQSSGNHSDELLPWVVRDGNQFYVSESTITLTNNSEITTPYSSLVNWAEYNPVDPAGATTLTDLQSIDFDEAGPYSPQTFSNVTGLGFYVEHEAATGPIHVHIEGFEASLIPEPSSALLCFLSLGGLVGFRRRK